MTSKPNSSNDQLPPDFDKGSHVLNPVTAISRGSPQMQVARKESSSGFMLLSVKHLSKAKRDKNSSVMTTNGGKMSPLDERFDDSCITKSSSLERDYKVNKRNSFELGRHFSSTASLDAEEYDDDDEEDLGVASEQENFILHQNAAIGINQCGSSLVHCQPPSLNPCRATHADCVANGHQTVDSVQPVVVSGLHPNQPASIDELRLSSNSQIHESVAQSIYDLPSQPASEHVYHQPSQPTMFRRLYSEVGSGTSQEPPIPPASHKLPSFLASSQQHSHHPELSAAKHSDTLFDSCAPSSAAATVTSSMLPSNQQNAYAGFPETATHRFVREFNEEHPRSASDAPIPPTPLSSLNAPVQPASRFRKARIRETVEQWGSNRLSFHDCRLKAVPDWVSYLQTKSVDTSFSHPILQRGRCLYCFVPGSFGSKCLTHKHNHSHSNGISLNDKKQLSSALPIVSVSSDLLHLLQAAFTAYHAYALRGYNLSSLLTTWCSGQRASNQALLEHVERLSSNITNHSLKVNASDGPIPSEHIGMASHTAANNSTEVNEVISCSGGEGASLEGITMVSGPSHHQQITSADQALASIKSPLKASTADPGESAAPRVTDPSAAYLRHRLTRSIDSGSTGEAVFMDGRIPQPCPPVQQRTDPSTIDQQFVPPTSPAGIGKATDVTHKPGIDGVSVPLLRPFDNAGSTSKPETAIASAPHSPGTELSGPKVLHTVEPPSGQSPLSDAVLQGKQNASERLTFTQPGELGVPSTLGVSDHTGAEYISPLAPSRLLDNISGGVQMSKFMSDPMVPMRPPRTAPIDLSAAASDIFQAAAAAVAVPAQPSSQPTGVACATSSVVGNLEAQMPKCMDVIRLAIMETIQDQFSHLNSENEALRAAVNNLQHENHLLQSYKRAFFDLRRFFQPEVWEQIENHVRLAEAAFSEQAALHFFPQSAQQPLLGNSHQAQQNTSFQPPPPTAPSHQSPTRLPPDLQHLSPPTSDAVLPHTTMNNSQ